ncbi:MAG TPA: hypothetical protein VHU85_14460 [Acidimicrobiales bacterium]|nr:hypothetical protein [Acidimicrobiales bacterium]
MIRGCAVAAAVVVTLGLGACSASPKVSSLTITTNNATTVPKVTTTVPKVTTTVPKVITTTTVAPPTTTTTTAPPPTTTAPPPTTTAPPPTTAAPAAPTGCFKDPEGNCYKAGEFCPSAQYNQTVQGASGPLQCVNNNGWRWEAA